MTWLAKAQLNREVNVMRQVCENNIQFFLPKEEGLL